MKYDDTINLLKILANAIFNPTSILNNNSRNFVFKYPNATEMNDGINNTSDTELENDDEEYDEGDSIDDIASENTNSYNNTKNSYYDKKEAASSNPQGIIDSITQEITPVRLQQAIILSEIVGKPKSKTRKRRF
ncbi:MAG: hypothetical protein LKH93_21130 [Clostridium beijerinckii]|jgi:hypothetical protein|uniref:Uncharacterized protein n=1 Tax=Clostridium diolis TaxID=223919 RepID=A0AAV3W1V1_9CLOT|nr:MULTISPECIES: hypothetical protein [Clostridium]ALB47233.1 hypothetical protein X276_19260 [Clostridium beijerinckii NRRL B-598]MCI1581224.1 hypothetical protein [Clostridium beijerinckii]MCI1585468.1 hypothetical protein [Clostridium beijerinckii]MCI1624678.1 hypothetical protein [Clostridium beijerinckii]MDG5852314.1 hypothetical protein [Clostridium beijerinckii]